MPALQLTLSRMRADAAVLVAVGLVVAIAAGVLAALPRAVDELAEASLATELEDAPVLRRSIRVEGLEPIPTGQGTDPLATLRAGGRAELAGAGPTLSAALREPRIVLDLPRLRLVPLPGDRGQDGNIQMLTLRVQEGIEDHLEVVDGRLPDGTIGRVTASDGEEFDLHEVALTPTTADQLGLSLGDRVLGEPDAEDALARGTSTLTFPPVAIEVVGLIELSDPTDEFWFDDARLHRPSRFDTGVAATFFGFGLVPVDAVAGLPRGTGQTPVTANWRFGVDTGAIDGATATRLVEDVRRLEASTTTVGGLGSRTVHTDLGATLDREVARRQVAEDTLTLAGLALTTVALALIALATALAVVRRRRGTALLRGRGASTGQLVAGQVLEALLVVVPAGAVGWLAAAVLVPRPHVPAASIAATVGIALAAVVLFVLTTALEVRRPLAEVFHDARARATDSPLRRGAEVLLGVIAVVGVVSLRRRGVDTGSGADLLVAAVPAVLLLAAGVIVARTYRRPLGRTGRWLGGRRGTVALAGFARSSRDPRLGPGVLTVVLAVGVSFLATAVAASVEATQDGHGWRQVGAPLRVDAAGGQVIDVPLIEDLRAAAGPTGAVAAIHATRATVRLEAGSAQVDVLLGDLDELAAVSAGSPEVFEPPPAARAPSSAATEEPSGRAAPVVPAIASRASPSGGTTRIGDRFTVRIGTARVTAEVVEVRDVLPVAGALAGPWLVMSDDVVAGATDVRRPANRVAVAAAADDLDRVAGAVAASEGDARVVRRHEVVTALRDQPLSRGVVAGFRALAWLALAGAAAALLAVVILTDRSRSRDLALLRALGASARSRRAIIAVEVSPPVVLAVLAGLATGLAATLLVGGALDLGPFVGGGTADTPGAAALARTAVGIFAAISIATTAIVLWPRPTHPERTLREGDTT